VAEITQRLFVTFGPERFVCEIGGTDEAPDDVQEPAPMEETYG